MGIENRGISLFLELTDQTAEGKCKREVKGECERGEISHIKTRIRVFLREKKADYCTVCAIILAEYGLE